MFDLSLENGGEQARIIDAQVKIYNEFVIRLLRDLQPKLNVACHTSVWNK